MFPLHLHSLRWALPPGGRSLAVRTQTGWPSHRPGLLPSPDLPHSVLFLSVILAASHHVGNPYAESSGSGDLGAWQHYIRDGGRGGLLWPFYILSSGEFHVQVLR